MFNQNKKLIAHSGFVASVRDEGVGQAYSRQIVFSDWFWGGGFLILISYLVIIAGTCVFISHLFSLIKEKKQNHKEYV